MFKVIDKGWARFECENIKVSFWYMADTPMDLLDAALDFMNTGKIQCVAFDGKDEFNALTFGNDGVYITKQLEKPKTIRLEIDAMRLIIEIFKSINGHVEEWTETFYGKLLLTDKDKTLYSTALKTRCMMLFELLKERINFSREDY